MVNGGDGTCHLTLTKFIQIYGERELPLIVHMRGGTMNTVARALNGIKGTPEMIMSTVAEKYRRHEPFALTERNILKANDWYGFIIGSGLVANFIEMYDEGEERGAIKAAGIILTGVSSAIAGTNYVQKLTKPVRAQISVAGKELPSARYTAILASSLREIGLGFKPTYLGGQKDGAFHFLCGDIPALEIVKNLPKLWLGKPIKTREFYDEVCREVTIKSDAEFKCLVDGEVYRCAGEVKITTGPRVRFIRC
jgi:diacylglycerol kinase family enzyme